MLPVKKRWANPMYFYGLPTYKQAKRVAWKEIKKLIPNDWLAGKPNETDMVIETVFGSSLIVFGMDQPARFEGSQYDGGVLDESSDQKDGVFYTTVLPTLIWRGGWCWRIGVPKRYGPGAKDFKDFYERGLKGTSIEGFPDLRIKSYTWSTETIPRREVKQAIAFARANLEQRDYNEQIGGRWETVGGLIFYAYDELFNVDSSITYNPNLPILVGSDFNVNPMAWVLAHKTEKGLNIFAEIWLRDTSTEQTLNVLWELFGKTHKGGWMFYGDATGRARKTAANSAAQSDYLIIRGDQRFKGAQVFYPKSNPAVVDRFASCNALFCNADKERRLRIHPRCKHLRADLTNRAYVEGTRAPDDYGDVGHITDALGYLVHRLYPLRGSIYSKTPEIGHKEAA